MQGRSPAWMRAAGCTTLVSAALLTLSQTSAIAAQDAASSGGAARAAPSSAPYIAVVTANAVNVRSGPSAQGAYVFGKLRSGATVQVLSEEFGWARVRTAGPAFVMVDGFVPADRRIAVEGNAETLAAGTTARGAVATATEVRAPNIDAGSAPEKSWKQIGVLEPGTAVEIRGIVKGEKESVYRIAMPVSAEGWVNMQFLRRATEQESAAHMTAESAQSAAPAAPMGAPVAASVETQGAAPRDPSLSGPTIPPLKGERALPSGGAPSMAAGTTTALPAGTKLDSHGEGSIEHAAPVARAPLASQVRRAAWNDLEAQWQAVKQQPEASAELDALRGRYAALATEAPSGSALAQMARARGEQLELMQEAQKQAQELAALKSSLSKRTQAIMKIVIDLQDRAEYAAIGVLNASVVYDGKRLPQLYRITDPQTSQTIVYVLPNETIPMGTMLGTLVGVKGGKEFDAALNINVISPQVIKILTERDSPQVSKVEGKTEAAPPAPAMAEKVAAPVAPAPPQMDYDDPDCWDHVPQMFEPDVPPSTTP